VHQHTNVLMLCICCITHVTHYRWDGGGRWRGKEWTRQLPTDAELLMHCFCCWCDALLPRQHADARPFTVRHYFEAAAVSSSSSGRGTAAALVLDPALLRGRVGLLRAGTAPGVPPHYQVTSFELFCNYVARTRCWFVSMYACELQKCRKLRKLS
jgi:Cytochrome B561, N terminal